MYLIKITFAHARPFKLGHIRRVQEIKKSIGLKRCVICKLKFIAIKQRTRKNVLQEELWEIAVQFIVKFYPSIFDGIVQLAGEKYSQPTQFSSFRMHSF